MVVVGIYDRCISILFSLAGSNMDSGIYLTDDGFIATAYHVIEGMLSTWEYINPRTVPSKILQAAYAMDSHGLKHPLDTTFCYFDEESDLAIIRAIKPDRPATKQLTFGNRTDTAVFVAPNNIKEEGFDLAVQAGNVIRQDEKFYWVNVRSVPGNSGSPYFTTDGSVLGIHLGVNILNNMAYAAPSSKLAELIEDAAKSLAEAYQKETGYNPLSRYYLPSYIPDMQRAQKLAKILA